MSKRKYRTFKFEGREGNDRRVRDAMIRADAGDVVELWQGTIKHCVADAQGCILEEPDGTISRNGEQVLWKGESVHWEGHPEGIVVQTAESRNMLLLNGAKQLDCWHPRDIMTWRTDANGRIVFKLMDLFIRDGVVLFEHMAEFWRVSGVDVYTQQNETFFRNGEQVYCGETRGWVWWPHDGDIWTVQRRGDIISCNGQQKLRTPVHSFYVTDDGVVTCSSLHGTNAILELHVMRKGFDPDAVLCV